MQESMNDSANSQNKPSSQPQKQHQPSNSELFASAKLMAEAAQQSTMGSESEKVDKTKLAGAAEDLLAAGSHYANLDEAGYGKYVDKAENYLHQYHASDASSTISGGHSDSAAAAATTTPTQSSTNQDGGDAQSGSKYGKYFKVAEGFLKKE